MVKCGIYQLEQNWILTAEVACFRDDQVYSQLLGCLGCVCVHKTLYKTY